MTDEKTKSKAVSFWMDDNHSVLLDEMAYRKRMSKSELIRIMIDAEAEQMKLVVGLDGIVNEVLLDSAEVV